LFSFKNKFLYSKVKGLEILERLGSGQKKRKKNFIAALPFLGLGDCNICFMIIVCKQHNKLTSSVSKVPQTAQ